VLLWIFCIYIEVDKKITYVVSTFSSVDISSKNQATLISHQPPFSSQFTIEINFITKEW